MPVNDKPQGLVHDYDETETENRTRTVKERQS